MGGKRGTWGRHKSHRGLSFIVEGLYGHLISIGRHKENFPIVPSLVGLDESLVVKSIVLFVFPFCFLFLTLNVVKKIILWKQVLLPWFWDHPSLCCVWGSGVNGGDFLSSPLSFGWEESIASPPILVVIWNTWNLEHGWRTPWSFGTLLLTM